MNFIIICSLDHQVAQHQLWIIIELKNHSKNHTNSKDILEGMLNEHSKRTLFWPKTYSTDIIPPKY